MILEELAFGEETRSLRTSPLRDAFVPRAWSSHRLRCGGGLADHGDDEDIPLYVPVLGTVEGDRP